MRTCISLITSLIFFIIVSCNKEKSGSTDPEIIVIDIENKNRPLLSIEIERIIPIETSENCLLSYIGDFKFYKNRFYFLNSNRFKNPGLMLFDDEGDFLRKTGRGKGPGEMIEPFAFTINEQNSQIFIHDQAQNPSFIFDLDLNFVKQVKHDYVFMGDVQHIAQDTFLVYHHVPTTSARTIDQKYFKYTLYTEDFSQEEHLDVLVNGDQSLHLLHAVSNYNSNVLFIAPYNYNVFQLLDGKVIMRYVLDFGDCGLPQNELCEISDEEYREYMEQGDLVLPVSVFQTKNYLIFQVVFKEKVFVFVRSVKNEKIYCLNDSNVLPLDFIVRGITDDGVFYGYLEADNFIEYQESSGKYNDIEVSQDDNPYVILFKIKR